MPHWTPEGWSDKESFSLQKDGTLQVLKDGLYFVYAQVEFANNCIGLYKIICENQFNGFSRVPSKPN